jgi:hypothetical protein
MIDAEYYSGSVSDDSKHKKLTNEELLELDFIRKKL